MKKNCAKTCGECNGPPTQPLPGEIVLVITDIWEQYENNMRSFILNFIAKNFNIYTQDQWSMLCAKLGNFGLKDCFLEVGADSVFVLIAIDGNFVARAESL